MGTKSRNNKIKITRRVFSKFVAVLFLIPGFSRAESRKAEKTKIKVSTDPVKTAVFTRFCDAVIPADETPSASDLNLDDVLFVELRKYTAFRKWSDKLEKWLITSSQSVFKKDLNEINEDEFSELVAQFADDKKHFLYAGFNFSRHTLMKQYYSQEESWVGLMEYHTPQPLGYMNYTQRPVG